MDTELLRTFVTIAECQGFSAAGKVLHRTQSAVSLQMKRLETQMGKALFERTRRSVTLTPAGGRLLPYARHMLKLQDQAKREMGLYNRNELIRLGISEEQAMAYLPELLPTFAARFPNVRVEITCDVSTDLVSHFQEGLLDVVLSIRHTPTQSGRLLGRESLVWVVSEDKSPVHWKTLPLALNPEGCVFRAHAFAALGQEGRQWDVHYSSYSPTGINLPVQSGLALTIKTPRSVPKGCRVVNVDEGLPVLGHVDIELHRTPGVGSEAYIAFCDILTSIVTTADSLDNIDELNPQG